MKCPHCQVDIHNAARSIGVGKDIDGYWAVDLQNCPACSKLIIELRCNEVIDTRAGQGEGEVLSRNFVRPRSSARPNPHPDVPMEFAQDYIEAALVLSDSPKASAALSRRCLQHILREKAMVKKSDLAREIDEVINSKSLPSHLSDAIDAIRNIGNFAAHPVKSTATGEVIDVEPGEAEWTLDVLDGLFDFYFIQPALLARKKAALNEKLNQANKPPLK